MTNPQGPPFGDPSVWARPAGSAPPPEPPTRHIPRPVDGPTQHMPRPGEPPTLHMPRPGSPMDGPTQQFPMGPAAGGPGRGGPVKTKRRRFRLGDPLSIALIAVIVIALIAAGVLAGELYARHRADSVVAAATSCVVEDKATVSFGPAPFLLQHMTGHYNDISIQTAGNQIRAAKGMKADVNINDVRLGGNANSKGTIGSLNATITWSSDGIKQTIQNAIPLFGSFVSGVTTNPGDGTIELQGGLGSITAKPQVVNNGISLQVVSLTGLGFTLPSESVQPALDAFTNELTNNYPLGIHADTVQVTNSGVVGHFSTQNAAIPQGNQNPCFANL
jgi:LmeA-like phospholipid-binding